MTLFVNARFLTQPITGVQRYAVEVSKQLKHLRPELRFLTPKNVLHHQLAEQLGAERTGTLKGHAWEQLELPVYTRQGKLLSFCNTAPLLKRDQLVVLHDASMFAVPDTYSLAFRSWYKLLFLTLSRTARNVLTVSRFSQQELAQYCRVPETALTVVHEGAEHIHTEVADARILNRHQLRERPFLLAVGSQSPHKNFRGLVEALARLGPTPFDTVIVGGTHSSVFAQTSTLPSSIKQLGYVTDAELRALYEHADGFVHPTYYEGFGLPPLEAMTCGCPVVTSDAASLPEVCGDAALYFDPHDPADIAAKVHQLIGDAPLRQALRERGFARVQQFTWRRCAEGLLQQAEAVSVRLRAAAVDHEV